MKRRTFIKKSVQLAAGLSVIPFPYQLLASDTQKHASDLVTLGNTGIKTSRLAMGTGSWGWGGSSFQTRELGIKGLADLLRHAYDTGVIFWDSADQYGSHPHLKEALKYIPREKVVILTKTRATSEAEMKSDLDRFRQELGTDYIDIVLLHKMENPSWDKIKKPAMDVLSRAREDGIVKTHGVSCHTLSALKTAADCDWVQVDLVRFNPTGARMDADPAIVAPVIKKMKKQGKGIIGMKVLGAGRLTDKVDKCLQYQLGHDFIDAFTIGQSNATEFNDLVKRIPDASVRA